MTKKEIEDKVQELAKKFYWMKNGEEVYEVEQALQEIAQAAREEERQRIFKALTPSKIPYLGYCASWSDCVNWIETKKHSL